MPSIPRVLNSLCVCLICSLSCWLPAATAAVTIETRDGRILTGEVDVETDDQRLWIRREKEQIQLTTSVRWSEIVAAHDGQESLALELLPELLGQQASKATPAFLIQPASYQEPAGCPGCQENNQREQRRTSRKPRVRSLEIEAYLVNMDRDVEPDGLEILVAALDDQGMPVPVKGSLSARLWGERIQPHGSLVDYEKLQQWSQRVRPEDFDADGLASYRLRFRTVNPELDLGLHSDALLNVRLSAHGQGNYEASVPVQIRMFNPVRDRLQLTRGERFFPNELTERTRTRLPYRTHTRSVRSR